MLQNVHSTLCVTKSCVRNYIDELFNELEETYYQNNINSLNDNHQLEEYEEKKEKIKFQQEFDNSFKIVSKIL